MVRTYTELDATAGEASALTHEWGSVSFSRSFNGAPGVFASIQTFNGGNPAAVRVRNVTSGGAELQVEEEQSADEDTKHVAERVGYVAIAPGRASIGKGKHVAQVDVLSHKQGDGSEWRTYDHSLMMQTEPVVFGQLLTKHGGHPAHVRVRNVGGDSFEFQTEEWDYLNQHHTEEQVSFTVLSAGLYPRSDGGAIEVGTVETDETWTEVSLDVPNGGETTVAVSRTQTHNGGQAVVTRHRNVDASGFEVRLQEEEAKQNTDKAGHVSETVGYMAAVDSAAEAVTSGVADDVMDF